MKTSRSALAASALALTLSLIGSAARAQNPLDVWNVQLPDAAVCAETDAAALLQNPLTLLDAVRAALCGNPRARQAWHEARAQAAGVGQSKAAYLPNASASLSRSHDVIRGGFNSGEPNNVFGANFTLNWLLLDFGARAANVEQAQQALSAALAAHDGLVQQLIVAAAQSWYEATATQAAVAAARQAEATAAEIAEAADFKSQRGAATRTDALQARTAHAQATLARVRAEAQARTAIGALAHVLGLDVRSPIQLAADAALDPSTSTLEAAPIDGFLQDLDQLIADALAAHPTLQSARAQLAAAEAKLIATRSEGLPSISLTHGNYSNGRPGTALPTSRTTERLTTITLSFPIFEGFGRSYRMSAERAQIEARRADLAGQQSQISFEVWRAYEALQAESSNLKATASLMRSATESLQAARARYQAGAADTLDLLGALKDEAAARQERIQSLASWRLSRLRLLAGLGRLGIAALGA